jgi:hypothetical protein
MRRIECLDQLFDIAFLLLGHPDLVRSRGRRQPLYRTYVRMSRSPNEDLDPFKRVEALASGHDDVVSARRSDPAARPHAAEHILTDSDTVQP